jgi:hypothetical protein
MANVRSQRMNLSASEVRFINRWRRSERFWPIWRWVMLLVAIIFWSASAWILVQLVTPGGRVGASVPEMSFEQDVFWFMNLGCVALAVFTLIRWRGDPRTTLLLKLVEGVGSEPGAAPNCGPATPIGECGSQQGPQSVT